MRSASHRAIVKWISVPSALLVLLGLGGFSFAQTRLVSSRTRVTRPSLSRKLKSVLDPSPNIGSRPIHPPNTSDSWTGGGDGTSWNNASNWNNGIPNSSTVDVTIGTATAAVNDNLNNAQVANLTLSHAADGLTIANGIVLNVFGPTISNAGTITLGSTGNVTELVLQGNVTLSGGGTVTMSPNASNYIFGAATADTLTNQETIQGAGLIGGSFGTLTLVNSGTINANQSAGLSISATGSGNSNTGTIEATGGTLSLNSTTLANTGGTISANGQTLKVTSSTINGGAVTLTGAATLQLNNSTIHSGSTLTNSSTGTIEVLAGFASTLGGTINNSAGGTFKIDNAAVLDLEAGTYSQLGTVQLNSSGNVTELVLLGNVTLSGGTVTLSNNANNFIFGAVATDILTNQETIQGAGNIGNGQMGLTNSGTILANQSTPLIIHPSSSGFSNTGTLQVSNGDKMQVTGGPFTNFSGSTLTGGTYNVSGTLEIDELGTAGGEIVTNAAKIILNGPGSTIVDSASKNALTNLSSNTAAGAFTVSGGQTFTTAGNFSNLGTLTIGNGSAFTVAGTLAQISSSTLSGGTFVLGGNLNVGSGINITTNSSTLTLEGGTIMSGATNALTNLATNTKSLTLANNANFTTTGNFTNNGSLIVNGGSSFTVLHGKALSNYHNTGASANTLVGGSYTVAGTLAFDAGTTGAIKTDSANITLEGSGNFLNTSTGAPSSNALVNLATIASTGSFTLAQNANFTAAGNFTNSGKLTVNSGSTFGLTGSNVLTNLASGTLGSGTYTVGGTLQLTSANGGITTNAANLTLTGTSAKILDGSSNALAGFNNNTGTFTVSGGAALVTAPATFTNSGTLDVAKSSTLTVPGAGHGYSQTAGQTTIDGTLAGINGGATVTGGTILGAGTIRGNLSAGNASGNAVTINVGDNAKAGLLSITGTYTQLATGTMTGLINGTTVGTGYSQLKVTGTAALAGTINFTVASAFQSSLALGETFTALTASSVSGTFSNSTIAINATFHFNVSYTATGVVLTVASGPASAPNSSPAQGMTQSEMASAKPAAITAQSKTLVLVSGLRRGVGTSKIAKPIVVASWAAPAGHSNAIVARGSAGMSAPRIWERVPVMVSAGQVRPITARPITTAAPTRTVEADSTRVTRPTSDLRMGQSHAIGIQTPRVGWMGTVENRHVPVKNLSPMLTRIGR